MGTNWKCWFCPPFGAHWITTNFDQVTQAVGAAVDEILLGERPAAEALADAQQQVEQIMGR